MTGKAATWQRWLEPRQSRGRAWVLPVLLLNKAHKCLDCMARAQNKCDLLSLALLLRG